LSIPFDLDLVASLLIEGKRPSIFELQEQRLQIIEDTYERDSSAAFPIEDVAAAAYQGRLVGSRRIGVTIDQGALRAMVRHKFLIRDRADGESYSFRHDRVQDLFIAYRFLACSDEEFLQHLADARFTGVFVLLAARLCLDDANRLLIRLAASAEQRREHRVVDAFVRRLNELGKLQP
jgi:hypothetical protein